MVDAFSPNFSLDGLGLELGSVGRCEPTRANLPLHLTHPLALSETALLANVNDEPLRARLRVFASFEPGLTSTLSCLTLCADRQSTGAST